MHRTMTRTILWISRSLTQIPPPSKPSSMTFRPIKEWQFSPLPTTLPTETTSSPSASSPMAGMKLPTFPSGTASSRLWMRTSSGVSMAKPRMTPVDRVMIPL
ncbi:hypothetical protein L202_04754 [Cryptococcus amylolentus CBS 6039]|uniref:Uncharacterized protein n=1 Tax=Cryptococcus amylolentus CBS 6039 TaxID=1295533 RepID=A0A1E3HPF7_9TREE|nr:hypothetical protein L202_04754 [Cryptococcus amylolentus CBS 6039]ODN77586.1 hypothetical protein L202_04754 [Cryptococcus amylolentus CBS 6039]